jgi:DNA-directed RNA polymerase specialized sigma subunit
VASELRAQNPGSERDAAIRQYAPLVKYVVGRLAIGLPAILDYEDILSYGTIGLIEALDRYDDSKGVKFETFLPQRGKPRRQTPAEMAAIVGGVVAAVEARKGGR